MHSLGKNLETSHQSTPSHAGVLGNSVYDASARLMLRVEYQCQGQPMNVRQVHFKVSNISVHQATGGGMGLRSIIDLPFSIVSLQKHSYQHYSTQSPAANSYQKHKPHWHK